MTQISNYSPGLLIAVPQLMDPNFFHSVVLLIDHTPEGAMGLTINHRTDQTILSLYQQMGRPWPGDDETYLLRGGPVQPEHAWILHGPTCISGSVHRVSDEIFLNTSLETMDELAESAEAFRFFVGYAGWGPGQLDREIQEGAWIISDLDSSLVFETPLEEVWETSLRRMGIDPALLVIGTGVH